jgi:hypothetical protein
MGIRELPSTDAVAASDGIAIYSNNAGGDRRLPFSVLTAAIQALITGTSRQETQYFAPSATGWAVTVSPTVNGNNVFLLITPTAGFAAGTITLPLQTQAQHGQTVEVVSTQAVTVLTVAGNGATAVNGAPTTLIANSFFKLRYDGVLKSWYRIG